MTERSWIRFSEIATAPRRKTRVWGVTSNLTGTVIGRVRWESAWRCYVFVPTPTLRPFFDGVCLRQLGEFCGERTREQRNTWKSSCASGRSPGKGNR